MKKLFQNILLGVMGLVICVSFAHANYTQRSDVQYFIEQASQQGLNKTFVNNVLSQAQRQNSIVRIMRPKPKPKTSDKPTYTPWYKYRRNFITDKRINEGLWFWNQHARTLQRAEKQYGVPASVIVGIIGVETAFGTNMGSYRVLDALTTLAFDSPRRQEFFQKELLEFLLMVQEQGLDPNSLYGSYAGAMGYGQFMPSSFRKYAVDFDGDGRTDIWNNPVDAIGSVANYFKQHGWITAGKVVTRAYTYKTVEDSDANEYRYTHTTIGELKARGFEPADKSLRNSRKAGLIKLRGQYGTEYWLGLHNFFVITEYNHTRRYALAVYQLGQDIKSVRRFSKQ